jgi:hypothetical protein
LAVAQFPGLQFQPAEMFPQGVAHQGGPVLPSALRGFIGGVYQLFIHHDLNDLHMWNPFHSILHIEDISKQAVASRSWPTQAIHIGIPHSICSIPRRPSACVRLQVTLSAAKLGARVGAEHEKDRPGGIGLSIDRREEQGTWGLALTRLLGKLLYQVSPRDPVAFGSAMVVMMAVAMAACVLPAWRATRTDPVRALRG